MYGSDAIYYSERPVVPITQPPSSRSISVMNNELVERSGSLLQGKMAESDAIRYSEPVLAFQLKLHLCHR